MRISATQRIQNENRIRAAMDRLLRGEIPPGGSCDVKTLARAAGVDRAAFYSNRPYAHLRIEFEQRLQQSQRDGHTPDPKAAQIERLRADVDKLKTLLAQAHTTIDQPTLRLPHPGAGTAGRATRRDPAEANAAPQAAPTLDAPDDITGVVAGSLNATDADGDALTYAVTGAPTGGTVTVDQAGTFVYTLTQATRLKAGSTAGGDIDSFTVTISDGQTTTAVPVTVAVSNEVTSVDSPITVGTNPTGVATTTTATGTYTYVANQSSNIVSVIDSNNEVVSTITVGSAPTGVAASPDGSKVYVTNRSTGKLSVIDTNTNKVVSTITVGSAPTGVPFTSEILDRCEQIMREACADFGAQLHEFNGETDHVHLLVHYPPKVAL